MLLLKVGYAQLSDEWQAQMVGRLGDAEINLAGLKSSIKDAHRPQGYGRTKPWGQSITNCLCWMAEGLFIELLHKPLESKGAWVDFLGWPGEWVAQRLLEGWRPPELLQKPAAGRLPVQGGPG
ncbi:uncharacterized protein LOC144150106 isoform X1 [Haemaphysalis longicornis]